MGTSPTPAISFHQGEIVAKGTYDQLQADGTDFASLLQERDQAREETPTDDKPTVMIKYPRRSKLSSVSSAGSVYSVGSPDSIEESKSLLEKDPENFDQDADHVPQQAPKEMQGTGKVGQDVYLEYFRCGAGRLLGFFFVILYVTSHVNYILCEWWISVWASRYETYKNSSTEVATSGISDRNSTATTSANFSYAATLANMPFSTSTGRDVVKETFDSQFYLLVYVVLIISTYFLISLGCVMHFYIFISSGIRMHNKMFRAILQAPVRFFDTNPSGQILNRFSKDLGQIDDRLPELSLDFMFIAGSVFSILIMVAVINYLAIIIIVPLLAAFFWLRQYYLKTSNNVKRLEGSTRSPVFSLLSSTLQGLSTVRAFKAQGDFEQEFNERQDLHSCAWYLFLCARRWFGIRLDLLSAAFISSVSILSVATLSIVPLSSGQVGLMLSYSILLLGLFQWGVRHSTEVENMMTSVERVQQYYRIPPEAQDEVPDKKPPSSWPTHGAVTFDKVSFAYYEGGPTVLNGIKLDINAKEKVGIVGRTGAGKSSLISALFRLSELTGGEILIDGVPITPLGLKDLRSSLSIIPQDPMLFSGTMKRNLDPFSQYTEEDLWDALEQVQLRDVIDSLPSKLDTELAESGSNFSVGQRQLVCLARAVLRRSKILVIDEATANVDIRTDRLIQQTIREKFKHCTVLTIAHRINTIIDSDRVLVLDAGSVLEFNEPHVLLQNPNSSFSKLVNSATANEAESLKKMAEEAFKARLEKSTS